MHPADCRVGEKLGSGRDWKGEVEDKVMRMRKNAIKD
jgi:hypothetical protein